MSFDLPAKVAPHRGRREIAPDVPEAASHESELAKKNAWHGRNGAIGELEENPLAAERSKTLTQDRSLPGQGPTDPRQRRDDGLYSADLMPD